MSPDDAYDDDDSRPTLPITSGPPAAPVTGDPSFAERYLPEQALGEGGMGVVKLFLDRRIGRRVAIKVARDRGRREAVQRFLREARVQGQLEHPAVVPVYDIGVTPEGAHYFSMKRVRGVTLEQVLDRLARRDPDALMRYTQRRLLGAFNSVCLAIDFAHQHAVVHRDLKPANVMLGAYGEVYVLDWGLAKLIVEDDVTQSGASERAALAAQVTVAGAVLGTPGYMSPEQMRGEVDQVGPASDIYALGAILFEIVTGRPLHDRHTLQSIVESTLDGVETRPSRRFPELYVAPDLEALIVRATHPNPHRRFVRARELSEAIERHLDGERDVARRRELAEMHTAAAHSALDAARREIGNTFDARRRAMREIGRALALDPGHGAALDAMVQLLNEPPRALPPEVQLSLAANERHKLRWIGKVGGFAYASFFLYLPLLAWVGVRSWGWVALVYALAALASGISFWTGLRRNPPEWVVIIVLIVSSLLFVSTSMFFGPLVLPPLLIAINTTVFTLYLPPRHRMLAAFAGAAAVLLPSALWLAGVIPGYRIEGGAIALEGSVLEANALPLGILMVSAAAGSVVTGGVAVTRVRDALARTEQQIFLYAWHLRELVPEAARPITDPTPARRASLPAEPSLRSER